MRIKTICVVTGSRADYGLLYWLMQEIREDSDLNLQVVATGMHLSPEFGNTYKLIEADGFDIDARVEMLLSSDSPVGVAKSVGVGVIGFADAFDRLKPDIILILGDRFEILAAAQAAFLSLIPVAHISGGELTEGVVDDAIRHAITKFSVLHFTANEVYRNRVIQLGEKPDTVFNVGEIGLDTIRRMSFLSRQELEAELSVEFKENVFLITYHPETADAGNVREKCKCLLSALSGFKNATLIFTKTNADASGRIINRLFMEFAAVHKERTLYYDVMGSLRYLSALRVADVVIGNSSSGIVEAPSLKTPTVNVGIRQKGRLAARSVVNTGYAEDEIVKAIKTVMHPDFLSIDGIFDNPYEGVHTSQDVKNIIKNSSVCSVRKQFHDIREMP